MGTFWRRLVSCAPLTIVLTIVVVAGLTALTIFTSPPPDLDDPIKGSEARGTPIKGHEAALANFLALNITTIPDVNIDVNLYLATPVFEQLLTEGDCMSGMCSSSSGNAGDDTLCNVLSSEDKFHLTFTSSGGEDLYSAGTLRAMCEFSERLKTLDGVQTDCPVYSVGYHVAALTGTPCSQLRQSDLDQARTILISCAEYEHKSNATENCLLHPCPGVPPECTDNSAVYQTLTYLTDVGFIQETDDSIVSGDLTYAQIFISLIDIENALEFYNLMMQLEYDVSYLDLVGVDTTVKSDLYREYIKTDMIYFAMGLGVILLLTYLYTNSLIITIALMLDVIFSYALAYFCYFMIFRITFFPFMNLLAALLVVAIAADDLFLFHDMWEQEKMTGVETDMSIWLQKTFSHAALSIFTTSFTTASALYSNVYSNITIIKCFAVFSGTAILCNFFIAITFIPAVIIVQERLTATFCSKPPMRCCAVLRERMQHAGQAIFRQVFPWLINKLYPLWLILFTIISAGGFFAVYYKPKLELPTTATYQLLTEDQLPENYDLNLRENFLFEILYDSSFSAYGLPLHFVWGLVPGDNGSPFNPDDDGELIYDTTFDISSLDSQNFMVAFCEHLKAAAFVFGTVQEQRCTMDLFNTFMTSPCIDTSLEPCCGQLVAPFPVTLFKVCFPRFIHVLLTVTEMGDLLGVPYFNANNDVIVYTVTCQSKQELVYLYEEMNAFYTAITGFINDENAAAPAGVQNAFVTTNLRFYDLQHSLISGTYVAFGISVGIAFIVVVVTTRNMLTTIYSMTTIACTIFVTVACLALAGWELNVLESIILSISVGLSIDFAIHYSVAYLLAEDDRRSKRITTSFTRVGSPVAMAALTTFLAGVPNLTSHVRGYQQLGQFLMVVMGISWIFATFFFQSICRFIGPLNNECQIPSPTACCRRYESNKNGRQEPDGEDNMAIDNRSLSLSSWHTEYPSISRDSREGERPMADRYTVYSLPRAHNRTLQPAPETYASSTLPNPMPQKLNSPPSACIQQYQYCSNSPKNRRLAKPSEDVFYYTPYGRPVLTLHPPPRPPSRAAFDLQGGDESAQRSNNHSPRALPRIKRLVYSPQQRRHPVAYQQSGVHTTNFM